VEAGGDIEKAIAILRKKDSCGRKKKPCASYEGSWQLHPRRWKNRRAGGAELQSDFVARTEAFQQLRMICDAHRGADPRYVRREEVTRRC